MKNITYPLIESMQKYIGQTVIIYTESGGYSGRGFRGVLISSNNLVRLFITSPRKNIGMNIMGAIVVIPIYSIVAFSHKEY